LFRAGAQPGEINRVSHRGIRVTLFPTGVLT
jgi:hypothetical protein